MAEGSTPQISRAYSVMVLSLENLPEHAMFLMTFLVHSRGSWEEERQCQHSVAHPVLSWLAALQGTGWFKTPWCGAAEAAKPASPCPRLLARCGVHKKGSTGAHSSHLPRVFPPHCRSQRPQPSHSAVAMSYHEQLVHLALALNVGLIVCKHLKPETQSRVWLGFALRAGHTSSPEQAGLPPEQGCFPGLTCRGT